MSSGSMEIAGSRGVLDNLRNRGVGRLPAALLSAWARAATSLRQVLSARGILYANPADYTIDVHVLASRLNTVRQVSRKGSTLPRATQDLVALIGNVGYELQSELFVSRGVLPTGDYKARLVLDQEKPSGEFQREYELLFADRSVRRFRVTAQMESGEPVPVRKPAPRRSLSVSR